MAEIVHRLQVTFEQSPMGPTAAAASLFCTVCGAVVDEGLGFIEDELTLCPKCLTLYDEVPEDTIPHWP